MGLGLLLIVFAVSLVFVLVSIIKFNLHPFLSLLIGGLIMGILAGLPLTQVADGLAAGFGSTMQGIGILIILGVGLGHLLHISGCTSQIAAAMLKLTGQKRAGVAVNLTGYIVSIPVFFDAAFVILVNLVKSLSRKGKIPFVSLVTALSVGLIVTHAMVIPTPGPIAVNSATFVGYRVCGFTGALCATLGVVLPSFLVITAIAFVLREFQSMKVVQYAFFGIRAGVLALILKALWSMYRQCPKNPVSYAIAAGSFILAAILNVNVLLVLILCAAAGFLASTISLRRAES